MDFKTEEQDANSRILAAVQFLAEQHGLSVPGDLVSVSGSEPERRVKRLRATAGFLEMLALESIQGGLAAKFAAYGYTALSDLRKASLDDLQAVDGIGKKTAETIQKALTGDSSNRLEPIAPAGVTVELIDEISPLEDEPTVDAMLDEMIDE